MAARREPDPSSCFAWTEDLPWPKSWLLQQGCEELDAPLQRFGAAALDRKAPLVAGGSQDVETSADIHFAVADRGAGSHSRIVPGRLFSHDIFQVHMLDVFDHRLECLDRVVACGLCEILVQFRRSWPTRLTGILASSDFGGKGAPRAGWHR